jgi:hypothetical protein
MLANYLAGLWESESRLRQMISVAETISPVFSGLMKSIKLLLILKVEDSGTSNRVLATFISWLSEKSKPVFNCYGE